MLDLSANYECCMLTTLLGLLIIKRPIRHFQTCMYAFTYCMSACVMHELQHGTLRREQVRIRGPSSLCRRGLE